MAVNIAGLLCDMPKCLVCFLDEVHQFFLDERIEVVDLLDQLFFTPVITPDEEEHQADVWANLFD